MDNYLLVQRKQDIFFEQVKLLRKQSIESTIGLSFSEIGILSMFHSYLSNNQYIIWSILMVLVLSAEILLIFQFKHFKEDHKSRVKWVVYLTICNTFFAILSSTLGVWLFLPEHPLVLSIYCIFLIGVGFAFSVSLASVRYIYIFFSIPIFLPLAICFFLWGEEFSIFGLILIAGAIVIILWNHHIYKTILNAIQLQFKNADLIIELEQKRQDAEQEKTNAEQANLLKTKFLASASHDLRQPLHTMSLFLEILSSKTNNQEQQALINKISTSNEALTKMLNTLLDISKLDANTIEVNNTHFKMSTLLEKLINDFTPLAKENNIRLQVENCSHICVYSDMFHVDRILRNLLSNAIKYSDQGEVIVSCKKDHTDTYTITVNNTRSIISLDEQDKIFDEFYQIDNPERDRRQGLGLGLSIVRRLCHLIGSEICISSTKEQGTSLFFSIAKGNASKVGVVNETKYTGLIPNLKLLIIDDDAEILTAMQTLLTDWGCKIEVAQSTEAALVLMQQKNYIPKIIISDYRLGDKVTGIDTIRAIKQALNNQTIPSIILTGDTTPEVIMQCKKENHLLLYKPIKPAKLLSTLNSCLKPSKE